MNVFHRVALQGLKRSRTRTAVTIVGVILSAGMITAVSTFGVSLLNYMANGAIAKYGDWHAAFLNADSAFVQAQAENPEVERVVTVENLGYAALDGGKNPDKPYLFLAGYSEEALAALPVALLSGRLPRNGGEILVSGKVATEAGVRLAVGDDVSLAPGSRQSGGQTLGQSDPYAAGEALVPGSARTYRVVGVCQRPFFESDAAPGYTLITMADAGGEPDGFSLFVTLKNPRRLQAYLDGAGVGHAAVLNDNVLRFMGLSDDRLFNNLLVAVGGVVIAIIMIGSIFLIYNSFNISLNERTQQFGILMSVGATARQLRNSVLFEGLCIGAVGIPVGILTGLLGIRLVTGVVAKTFGSILYVGVPLTVAVSLPALLAAAAVSLVTILISADIPARKAVNTPVMECIRQTNEIKVSAKAVRTSGLVQRLCGLEGTLALKNFKRNRKRYRSIVLSLVLSVALFVSASAFVRDMKQSAGQTAELTDYDIAVATPNLDDGELLPLYEALKGTSGVYESAYQETYLYTGLADAAALSDAYRAYAAPPAPGGAAALPLRLQFLDDATYFAILTGLGLSPADYTGADAKLLAVARFEDAGASVDLFNCAETGLTLVPRESVGAAQPGLEVQLRPVFFVPPDMLPVLSGMEPSPVFFQALAPYSLKTQFTVPGAAAEMKGMTFLSETPTRSAAEMEAMLEGAGVTTGYSLYNMNRLMDENRNYIFIVDVFAYTFIAMISLIAVANVFNTISTNVKLRRRELAMLRSVGMAERDFQRMMNFECAFYGMRALLVGLPVAVGCAFLIHRVMFAESAVFTVPWGSLGISVAGVLSIVFITMLYAVAKIKKENIIDALRDDMT